MADTPGGPAWEQGNDGKWYQPGVLSGAGWIRRPDNIWYPPPPPRKPSANWRDPLGDVHPQLSRYRTPGKRDVFFWLNPNTGRGEHWPAWYWLLSLVIIAGITIGLAYLTTPIYLIAMPLPAAMVLWALGRRIVFGYKGPRRRSSETDSKPR